VSDEEPRIGVYVCHCGLNIAAVVDCPSVAQASSTLPNVVVSKDYRYMCSDPGQELIRKDIEEHGLNRVVVAACSPRMHEPTFRRCVEQAGVNPYLFEMANIREFSSWCHSHEPERATEKSADLVAMAVAKARHLNPLNVLKVPVTHEALVIGGGVAGIHASLDLADMGYKVHLVERSQSIGGKMAQLDKTFPTLDCSICILGPEMVDINQHPNIDLLSFSEIKKVEGYIGNFHVTVEKKPRYVDEELCNGCGECSKVCPIEVPNSYEEGLGPRKAISVPFPQAIPMRFVIDKEACIECYKCVDACREQGRDAINFSMEPETVEIDVGTIIVATGYEMYDPTNIKPYGYGVYDNVVTAMEIERMVNAAGPTFGHVVRPSDRKEPHRVVFVTCVGSRDEKNVKYCSGFCCMYTLKNAVLLKDHFTEMDITILYMDMRTNMKGYEEFYRRARDMGIKFIRGHPDEIFEEPETKNLIISVEDINMGRPIDLETEMVVLSQAAVPAEGTKELSQILTVSTDASGFFLEAHPKLKPVDAPTDGIFFAGSAQGLKDIPYSVAQGSAAASRSARVLSQDEWMVEPITAKVDPEKCTSCGVCASKCPYGAITVEKGSPAVITEAKCHGCGTCVAECPSNALTQQHFTDEQILAQIDAALEHDPENKILGFLCNWCSYAGADLAGISRHQFPTNLRPIRVMCSGRVKREFVYEAFLKGAGMVMVSGCHFADCHYISGNYNADKRIKSTFNIIERAGITPDRLRLEWFSAAEGEYYARITKEMVEHIKELGIERIREENMKAAPMLERLMGRVRKSV
jgi:heterodisulfide reductase subunit A